MEAKVLTLVRALSQNILIMLQWDAEEILTLSQTMEDFYLWITWLCRQPATKPEEPHHSCSWTSHTSRSLSHQGKLKGYGDADI